MVVQLQQLFSILIHHPVSGPKVASALFLLMPETPPPGQEGRSARIRFSNSRMNI